MRKITPVLTLLSALAFVLVVNAAPPPNFAGTWVLDKSKTQNVPRQWENATSVTLEIKQDDKQVTLETKAEGSQFPSQPLTYNLDGTESTVEMTGRIPGKATLKAAWTNEGNTLELSRKQSGNFNGQDFTFTTNERLTLSEGGKVLTIARSSESPRGKQESTLVFNKK
ncbi:MAG TPA: hypothetical protein VJM12_20350 [Pyrinomonadaceae bacterium]|nr:hypothetical protein [Pyrinomonadaceae bacterium]